MMKKASHYNVFQRPVVFSKPMSFRKSLQATLDFCAQYTLSLHLWMSFNTLFISFMFTFSAALKSDQKWLVCDNNKTQKFLSQNCFKCACGSDFVYFDRISANHEEIFMVNAILKICIWNLAVNLINNLFFPGKNKQLENCIRMLKCYKFLFKRNKELGFTFCWPEAARTLEVVSCLFCQHSLFFQRDDDDDD